MKVPLKLYGENDKEVFVWLSSPARQNHLLQASWLARKWWKMKKRAVSKFLRGQ